MDLYLNKERINIVKNVLSTTLTQEESLEMIVPDALPDILRIVCADATVLVRGKETDTGRVSVSGVAAAVVLYSPEGADSVRKMSLDIPFNISAAESEITTASNVTVRIQAVTAEAVIINPRKLSVKVNLCAEIACYNSSELLICGNADPDEDAGIEILREICSVTTPVDVREKPFVIADDLLLPNSGSEISELLRTRVSLTTEEARVVGNKLIFRGTTTISILYNSIHGELCGTDLTSEYSQIMEIENLSEESDFDISLMLTGAYFEIGGIDNTVNKALSIELHIVAQCVALEKKQIPFISDVYSTRYKFSQSSEKAFVYNMEYANKQSVVFRETISTEATAARVISTNVSTGSVDMTSDNNTVTMTTPLYVTVIYADENGRILATNGKFIAEATSEIRAGCKFTARAECGKEIYGAPSGNGIEFRLPIEFIIVEIEEMQINSISDISYDDEAPVDISRIPSLTLSRITRGDTLWKLAKKHHSTKTLILSANSIDSEEEIHAGQMLIIPKKR